MHLNLEVIKYCFLLRLVVVCRFLVFKLAGFGLGVTLADRNVSVAQVPKKSQFSLKRQKTKTEVEFGDLVCPLDASAPVPEFKTGEAKLNDRVSPNILISNF